MHFPGKEVAKAVAFCAGKKVLLAVLPASYHINFEKLSTVVGDQVQLLEQEKCNELFPDCETGAIPPFGELYGVPVARQGHRIMQFLSEGRYIANVVEGKVTFYGRRAAGLGLVR